MISNEQKLQIVEAVKLKEQNYGSAAKFAVVLGINSAQLSRIKKGDIEGVLSDGNWISIARKVGVELGKRMELKVAPTPVFNFIMGQLEACQAGSLSGMLCDSSDIGKTFAARHYANTHKYAVYIDCSQNKSKQKLIRAIAKEFGISNNGKYADVYADLVCYLKLIPTPIVILDEAGDLEYSAFLELKALWNAAEWFCGWYMMGADGFRAKFDGNVGRKKVGYAEIFSRYGSRYQRITPEGDEGDKAFAKQQTAIIAKANGVADVQALYAKTQGSLRRIYIEIQKLKQTA